MTTAKQSSDQTVSSQHSPIALDIVGSIGELALNNGPLNLVDKALMRALNAVLAEVEHNANMSRRLDARASAAGTYVGSSSSA